jgi:hypothetical protein
MSGRVTFEPLDDLEAARAVFGPGSVYVEYCLLPLLGPTCCALYRHVAPLIDPARGVTLDLAQLAANLGLGAKTGPSSPVVKALDRLEAFRIGQWRTPERYALRTALAPLSDRQARRLPEPARTIHYRSLPHSPTTDPVGRVTDGPGPRS